METKFENYCIRITKNKKRHFYKGIVEKTNKLVFAKSLGTCAKFIFKSNAEFAAEKAAAILAKNGIKNFNIEIIEL